MSNITEPTNKINKIFSFLGNTVTIFSGIFGVLSWIFRFVINMILIDSNSLFSKILTCILYFSAGAFIIGLICLFVSIIYTAIKCKSEAFYIQRKITEFIHVQLIHKIRNNIVQLEELSIKLNSYYKANNQDAISECYNTETENLRNNLKKYINPLADYLTKYRNITISSCVKIFSKRDKNRHDFQSEEIMTFVRSSNTEDERKNGSSTTVGQNTDFSNLCKGSTIFFGCSNLNKIHNSGQYVNDSINFENNKYTSTLVTPIRYYNASASNGNNNIKPDVIGFLCIDCEEEIKEWENPDSFELQIMAVFSDIIYVYIKEFYECFEKNGFVKK